MKGPDLRSLSERLADPAFVARHGHRPMLVLLAVQFLLLPLAVAAMVPEYGGFYTGLLDSGFGWFGIAFVGNWLLGSGFSIGILSLLILGM